MPTYAGIGDPVVEVVGAPSSQKARGLEGVLNQGPALMVDNVLTRESCEGIIQDCENLGFGIFRSGKNHHGALQILVSKALADSVAQRLSHHIDLGEVEALRQEMNHAVNNYNIDEGEDVRLVFSGLNRRWRIYRYDPSGDESFAPHIDAGFPPSDLALYAGLPSSDFPL